ncbi:MAG: hemerythrin domain-containing protein [Sphingomicrobium sp.]
MAQDIFDRLIQDHDKHRGLIERIGETEGDSDDRRTLFEQYKVDANAHAAAEEETLYATIMAMTDMRQDAQHSVKEHADLGMLFVELDEMDMSSSGWLTKFKTLAHDYIHHIDEEEKEKFPKAKKAIGADKAIELRAEFNARKPEEVDRAEAKTDVPEIKKAIKEEAE